MASRFQILSEEFILFVRAAGHGRAATDAMHRAHAEVRDALMLEDFTGDAWETHESAWASACSARAVRTGRDPYASWRSYFLDTRAIARIRAAKPAAAAEDS